MKTERSELVDKIQKLAEKLIVDIHSSPFDGRSAHSLVDEMSEALDELHEFNEVEGWLELEESN